MKRIALLLSPLAKNAYFKDYLEIAKIELLDLLGDEQLIEHRMIAAMDFFELEAAEKHLPALARLSSVLGVFEQSGEQLTPLAVDNGLQLHEDFVFAAKFKGKTNETLTQLLINVGLQRLDYSSLKSVKLLDPMCGRATTLLWAMRYGINAKGIEQDPRALVDIRQNIKKLCKLHRVKHQLKEGFIGKSNKHDKGKFIDFSTADNAMRVIAGDSAEASNMLKAEKFHLIVSDLPYSAQHFSADKAHKPLAVLEGLVSDWCKCLKPEGVMVLAFNRFIPRRDQLIAVIEAAGMQALDFSAPHRMSESVVRDVVVFKKAL